MKNNQIIRFICIISFMLLFCGNIFAQITLSVENKSIKQIIPEIEKQSGYTLFYSNALSGLNMVKNISVDNKSITETLDLLFQATDIAYQMKENKQILLVHKSTQSQAQQQGNNQQKHKVSGIVNDNSNAPVVGASILIKGTTVGTFTNLNGEFSLNTAKGQVLQISYIGFTTQEIVVKDNRSLSITLVENDRILDDVVVVGYSTRSREKLISSVGTISNAELAKTTTPNLENALTGRVSGVFSRQSSGEPGSDAANLQIRGFGAALVVVDGIPGRNYSQLDPSEIESISVLKDASAAAVYGMQGANGVILVTTKRGTKQKKTSIDINTRFGLQIPHNYPEVANATTWQALVNEYNANMKLINNRNALITNNELAIRDFPNETNWYDEMIKNAPISQSNINLSGGSDRIAYFFSTGFLHQDGIWSPNSTSKKRVNLRSNLDVDVTNDLSLSVGVGAFLDNLNYPGRSAAEIARSLKNTAPNIPLHWGEYPDYYAYGGEGTDNPMALADEATSGYTKYSTKNLNVDFAIKYNVPFVEGLSLKANLGYTSEDIWSKNWYKNIVYAGYRADANEYYQSASASNTNKASLSLSDGNNWNLTGQGFISYLNSFGKHNLNSGLVFEISQAQNKSTITSRGEFPSTILDMLEGGLNNKQVSNSESLREYRSASVIGRFSYDYASKYFVDFNARYDGAQYFADKWGLFPSAAIGWMVTREEFMGSLKPIINEFKIRASWGQLGDLSAAKGYYDSFEQYYFQSGYRYPGEIINFGDRTIYGLTPTVNANIAFTWSKSTMVNLGIDFKLWNGLLGGSAEVFRRNRSGLPAQKANDNAGALATWYNLNNDNTRGFEISLNHNNKIQELDYFVGGNISWSRTQNGHLEHGQFTSGYQQWKWYNGNQWNNVRWGLNQIGQYQSYEDIAHAPMHNNSNNNAVILPGDLKYEDWNGDGYIDEYDMRPIGRTSYPELVFGINMGASWKRFDINLFWQGGALSNFQISAFDMDAFEEGKTFRNAWNYFGDRWHKADYTDPNSGWAPGYFPAIRDMNAQTINRQPSNYWMWSGNYIRLKNVELGYTFPKKITGTGIKQLRIYGNLYNFLTFSSQKYFDPEQAETILSFASYPQIKSFNAGVNLKF